tara:strand:+ start:30 stop:671 length:642 start_codon:yes stop_codon:yes gene_type:complete
MLNRLVKKILIFTGRKIIQFSPQRSGSTLVFNILKDLFPTRVVLKVHNYNLDDKNFPTVITYRHPYDSIASLFLKDQITPTDEVIEDYIKQFREGGWNDFFDQIETSKILFLRYEDFCHDFDFVLNSFEDYFNISISENKRVRLKNKYKILNVKKNIEKFKDFSEYDEVSLFHGNHISKFSGNPSTYKKLFSKNQIKILDKYFNNEKKYLNYD